MIDIFGHSVPFPDLLYSVGCFMTILGFCVTNILYLRLIIILANIPIGISGIMFNSHVIIGWALLYVSVNGFMLILLLLERVPLMLPDNLKSLYRIFKFSMTTREFSRIIKICEPLTLQPGDYFVREGESGKGLLLVCRGEFEILVNNALIRSISQECFLGELSSLYEFKASADVRCKHKAECYLLSNQAIQNLKKSNKELYEKLFISASHGICQDLQTMNSLSSG